jgi:nucleoside-diphosphate-sugar epimerase
MHLANDIQSILVLGGTGSTGLHIVRMALDQGLRVTALTRHPEKFNGLGEHPRLEILKGDVLNYPDVYNAVQGNDAVVSALGKEGREVKILILGTSNIIRAIGQSSVRKLVCLSSFGAGSSRRVAGWPWRWIIRLGGMRTYFDAMAEQELLLYQSAIDFTLVMSGRLTEKRTCLQPLICSVQQAPCMSGLPPAISRQRLASVMLEQVVSNAWRRKTVCLLSD